MVEHLVELCLLLLVKKELGLVEKSNLLAFHEQVKLLVRLLVELL